MPKEGFLDGKTLFQVWSSWGKGASSTRLVEWARANMPNPETGTVSELGPWYAMWSWAIRHPRESYEMYKKLYFELHPDKPIVTFEEYLVNVLKEKAENNRNIASKTGFERFCARWGLTENPRVSDGDVIQVISPSHALFSRLMTVSEVSPEEGFVLAKIINPNGIPTNHQLKMKEFGVIGKAIV